MDKRKKIVSLIAGILVLAMVFGFIAMIVPVVTRAEAPKSSSAIKSEISGLKGEKSEIQNKIKDLEGQISENMSEMEDIVAQKNVLEQEITLLHDQINNINAQIAAYGVLISEKQSELDQAQERLADLNEKNKERIRTMEEEGSISYWSVLFKSSNFSDLLDRLNMVQEIAAADRKRLQDMREAAAAVETAKQELQSEKAELETSREELDATQVQLEGKKAEADELLNKLLATGVEYQKMVDEAEEESEKLSAEINKLDAEYRKAKDREYKEWLAKHPPVTPPASTGGGTAGAPSNVAGVTWLVPINYTHVASPFGMRMHPIYGYMKMHSGVDLAAAAGTPIIASRSGIVTVAGYEAGGAGNYVNINHMDGFTTRYMHMTNYIVSPGQKVTAGQVIGYCGATGAATGPHLHFSVYWNGTPVNPANYISI